MEKDQEYDFDGVLLENRKLLLASCLTGRLKVILLGYIHYCRREIPMTLFLMAATQAAGNSLMENCPALEIYFQKYLWKIKSFSTRKKRLKSDSFDIGNFPWRIYLIFPSSNDQPDDLSLYLKVSDRTFSPYLPVSFFACFRLTLINQVDPKRSIIKGSQQEFSARNRGWGLQSFTSLAELKDPNTGFLVRDTCLIEAEIFVPEGGIQEFQRLYAEHAERNGRIVETPVQEALTSTPPVPPRRPNFSQVVPTPRLERSESIDQKSEDDHSSSSRVPSIITRKLVGFYRDIGVEDTFVRIPDDMFSDRSFDSSSFVSDDFSSPRSIEASLPVYLETVRARVTDSPSDSCWSTESVRVVSNINMELSDFSGLGIDIDPTYVPLLEEVCARHPSLIQSQMNKTADFKKWAFTALGRVLYFLGTTKVKDMKEEALEYLQGLWVELETFKFDLTWLEPHLQSAVAMKIHLEKTNEVKLLKDKIDALEIDARKLKAELAVAEANLDEAKRNLEKAEEEIQEVDVNAVLGYI